MEMLLQPTREIERRFTRSELAIMAWRSQESYAQIKKGATKSTGSTQPQSGNTAAPAGEVTDKGRKIAPGQPTGYPDRFYNDEGLFDLSQVKGTEAHAYFRSMGVVLPIIRS